MAVRYDKAGRDCVGGPKPGTTLLEERLLEFAPGSRSGGIYNCRNVRGASSPSLHGEGRAVDIHPASPRQGDLIAQWAVANAKTWEIQEVIWNRSIWSSNKAHLGFRRYLGENPHTDHVHIGQNWSGANYDGIVAATPPRLLQRHQEFL